MDRNVIVNYLNGTIKDRIGFITHEDTVMMYEFIFRKTKKEISPKKILEAAMSSKQSSWNYYKENLINTLIREQKVVVLVGADMRVNGLVGTKVMKYI